MLFFKKKRRARPIIDKAEIVADFKQRQALAREQIGYIQLVKASQRPTHRQMRNALAANRARVDGCE